MPLARPDLTRGKPKRVGNAVSQLCFEPLTRHSEKPIVIKDKIKEESGRYQVSPEPRNPGDAVIHGDAGQVLEVLPAQSVQAIVTSPP
jgi:hypothetical protein